MKITIALGAFFPVPPTMGGAVEKAWFALAQEFAARSHEVTMISRKMPDLAREELVCGVRHFRVPGFDTPRSLLWLKALDLVYSLRVRQVLPAADILVTNTFWLPMLVRDPSHGKVYVHVGRYPKGQMRFYSHATRLQAPSTEIANAIARETPSLAGRTIAIPYPRPQTVLTEASPIEAREEIALYVGRVHPEKGVHLLVEAFARVSGSDLADWKLMIVGPGEVRQGGGGKAYENGLRRLGKKAPVEFCGPIFDDAELGSAFRRARIFVYPSLAARGETFGLAPLEAMSHGCAVIVSDLGCFRDFIVDNETGFVFDPDARDPAESLVTVLRSAVADPLRLARVAEAGHRKSEEFSLARVADRFLADFDLVRNDTAPLPLRTAAPTTPKAFEVSTRATIDAERTNR
jgi:glycosyltransferase involved in cell wall biosynthesis